MLSKIGHDGQMGQIGHMGHIGQIGQIGHIFLYNEISYKRGEIVLPIACC